jgi:hypothetical protein
MQKLLIILFWETAQNLWLFAPAIAGIRLLYAGEARLAAAVTVIGVGMGGVITHFTEPRITGEASSRDPGLILVNTGIFVGMALAGLFYYRANREHASRDWLFGVGFGVFMAFAQGIMNTSPLPGVIVHAAAMGIACAILLPAVRFMVTRPTWRDAAGVTLLVTVGVSALIVAFDYSYLVV